MSHIAVLGTGRMGTAVTTRLLTTGQQVTVWNRTPRRAAPLAAAGATVATTPAQAAEGARLVITLLSDATAVETAMFSAHGACAGLVPEAPLVQMSTIGPRATKALAARLPASARLVDAPVRGSVPQITAGELAILAAGADEDIARVAAELAVVGPVLNCGAIPAGSAAKLVVNAAMISTVSALAEVRALAGAMELPGELTAELLAASPLAPAVARARATGARFPVSLAAKDLGLALEQNADLALLNAARAQLAAYGEQSAELAAVVPDNPK